MIKNKGLNSNNFPSLFAMVGGICSDDQHDKTNLIEPFNNQNIKTATI